MNLERLYKSYDVLSAANEKISEHAVEYGHAIEATRGSTNEKKLAVQILSKFFKHFPDMQEKAIDAAFDLCEDDDPAIRIIVIKSLPIYCKDGNKYIANVTDTAAQLLQIDEPHESNIVNTALQQILKEHPVAVIKAIFKLINDKKVEAYLREKNLKFILNKCKSLDDQEAEDTVVQEIKDSLTISTPDEFVLMMNYLVTSKYSHTFVAQQELLDIVANKIDLDKALSVTEPGYEVDRIVTCVKFIMPLFSSKVESTKFVVFYCDQVLGHWDDIGSITHGNKYQIAILQQLAEMSAHCGKLERPSIQIVQIFDKLNKYMPAPPQETECTNKMPEMNFTVVECLLYAFHRLASQAPDFLTCDETVLRDFRAKLLYFSRGVQGCLKVLNLSDKEKIFSPEEKKLREISPKLLNNINSLIKDLFYKPPSYKCSVVLSFKTAVAESKPTTPSPAGNKRHAPITYENNGNAKQGRTHKNTANEKKIYSPPSGKYSNSFQNKPRGGNHYRGGQGGASRMRMGNRGRGGSFRNKY